MSGYLTYPGRPARHPGPDGPTGRLDERGRGTWSSHRAPRLVSVAMKKSPLVARSRSSRVAG